MKRRRFLRIAAATAGSLILFPFLTLLFIPSSVLMGVVTRGLEREGYEFRADSFGKSFPLGVKAENVLVSDERGALLKLDDASVGLRLFPLLTGRAVIAFRADIGAGRVLADFEPRSNALSFQADNLRLEDVPLLQVATGANIKGELYLDGSFQGRGSGTNGFVKLEVKRAELSAIKIGAFPLPDASYETIRGMFRAEGGKGTLESLAFQGDGIYIRLKGDVPISAAPAQSPLDLTLELMPKPVFYDKQKLVFMLLAKYQTTPGAYRIPIGGTLTSPSIQ